MLFFRAKNNKPEGICRKNLQASVETLACGVCRRKTKKQGDAVSDYCHPSYTRHPLGDIIVIVFFAVLGNINEWGKIESFAKKKEKWLRKYLELLCGIPTDDTFLLVISNIDTSHFFQVTVILLLQTVDGILRLSGKENGLHEESIIFAYGNESRSSKRKTRYGLGYMRYRL